MAHQYRFGDLLLDEQSFRLVQAGTPLAIEPKALNVLIFLVQNQGRLIERRELLSAVWGDSFVTDHVLNRSIGQLRKVLGDDAKEPRYIETVPTLGYRFIAAVETDTLGGPLSAPEGLKAPTGSEAYDRPLPIVHLPPVPDASSAPAPAIPAESILVVPEPEVIPIKRARFAPTLWFWGIGCAAFAAATVFLLKGPAVPGPLESTQITFSTDFKEIPIFTDGSRLYFERRGEPSEMAVGGGMVVPMRALEHGLHLRDISADGSKVLAWKADLNDENGGGTLWASSTLGGAARKLGDHSADRAVWSPDGRSIISSLGSNLYSMDETGGNFVPLWEAPGLVTDLAFSPDAKQLCVTVEMEHVSRIWMLRPDGTQAHPLAVEWPDDYDLQNGRWTPDGRHFVFRSDGEGRQNMYEIVKPDWLHFWRKPKAVRITGNQIEILASVPARNLEGLFVLGRLDQGAMQAFDPQSKTFSPFLNGFSAESFALSPDGQWMAYSEYPSGNLWKSRPDGSAAVQLTNATAYWEQWSPDGRSLVYSDWHKLYRVSADGGPPEKLMATGDYEMAPTLSPDGRSLVFNRWDYVHEPDGLFVLDLATRKVSPMEAAEKYYVASWSPDGRYLVAIARNPSRMMLYSAASRTWSVLKVFDMTWGLYSWSRDSKSIYMANVQEKKGFFRLSVPGGALDKIAGLENVDAKDVEAFVSMTADDRPVMMSHTGVAQFYLLRWPR